MVGKLYQLYEGGWLKVYYYDRIQFVMEVRDRWMIEVNYLELPQRYSVPIEFTMKQVEVKMQKDIIHPSKHAWMGECFYYYANKKLKAKQVKGYSLVSLYLYSSFL